MGRFFHKKSLNMGLIFYQKYSKTWVCFETAKIFDFWICKHCEIVKNGLAFKKKNP